MERTRCYECNNILSEEEVRWAFDNPYCESCFDNRYCYCCRCDDVLASDDAYVSDDGDSYCSNCWHGDLDEQCPENPDVDETDRALIVELSRNWLMGKSTRKAAISINAKDLHLKVLRDKVGLTDERLYVFGLLDRDEYQMTASSDIFDDVKEYLFYHHPHLVVQEATGRRRLGICLSLRANSMKSLVTLIRRLTKKTEAVCAE